ncbi:MAG: cytochrome c biogenesis protein CcsA, partial [Acidimicrobiia bacterium]|nr:cytochrome c biogenesis protein CcsA [Acidimicrobiia bacterium]
MTPVIGQLAVLIAAVSALTLAVQGFRGMARPRGASARTLRWPVYGIVAGAVVAMSVLEIAILRDDFSIEYIANNSATTTPFMFKIAAAWAALEGSILLWGLVLAIFVYTVYRQYSRRSEADALGSGALAVLGLITLFFFGLMLTVSNPFRVCIEAGTIGCFEGSGLPWANSFAALEGRGPNPLLQNHILMAVHPPTLYFGYVGMAVPFAFAMS